MNLRFLPNALTVLRILLIAPIVMLLVAGNYTMTLVVFGIAAATDAADGLLAKQFGWTSELGKLLDPIADKLLLLAAFATLTLVGLVPLWLTALIVGRDVVIGTGALVYKVAFGSLRGQPTAVSKLNTLCQILFVAAVIAEAAKVSMPAHVTLVAGALTLVTTVVSGLDYVLRYAGKAAEQSRLKSQH